MSLLLKIGGLQKLPSVVLLKVEVLFMEERTDVADSRTLQVICSRVTKNGKLGHSQTFGFYVKTVSVNRNAAVRVILE